ncbi:DNA-directed DNA polymerase, partial [Kickxella alabastrina]
MSSSTLDFYWGLSSLDEKQRIDSATQLIAALVKFQNSMPQTDEMATNEEEMAKLCASDVAYAIPRLIKGLASPRDGARQGFSIALSELLARIPCISVKLVLSLLWRFTEATNSMKGQEQRDMRFGRIFGLMALVQSGIIERTGTTAVDIRKIVMELTAIGSKKSYLREISYVTLTSMVPVLGKFEFKDELITMFVAVALDKGTIETPDELYLAMRLRREYPSYNWYTAFPHWQGKHMLSHKNVGKLAAILCETSTDNPALFSTWHSQLHTVWTEIFDLYFNKERAQEVADMAVMDFEVVWDHVVERGLFAPGASQFRRYWGFLLLERLMPHLSEENVPAMMTPNIVRGLSDNISLSGKSLLAKVGLRTAEKLIEICEGNTAVGLAVLTHLLNQRTTIQSPGPNTNNLRSMMANRIVAKLDSEAIVGYVDYLQKVFVTPKLARKNTTGVADPIMVTNVSDKSIEKQRGWAIDQMIRVAKYGQLPITDELTTNVLHFITAQAALKTITTIGTSGCGVAELEVRPTPPLSSASREYCAVTLISFVGDLNRMSTHKKDDTADAAVDAAAASAGRLSTGCSRNGTVWSTAVIAKLLDGAANAKVGVSLHGFEEIKPTLVKMLQVMRSMEARSVQYAKKSIDTALRFRALELLLGNICMMATFTVDSGLRAEYLEVIPELHECFEKIIIQLDPTGKKAKKAKKAAAIAAAATPAAAAELSEDDEPKPVEVLTDILISLLTKDSNSLRKLCEQVFAPFTGLMTADALDSIIGVLQAREGVTGEDDGNVETQMELIDGEQDIDASHSGSDSDSDSDDELEQVEAVDEELRRKIEEALGNGSGDMDQAERSASGEEEEFDDDQMK